MAELLVVQEASSSPILPWLLPFVLGAFGSAMVVWSRRLKKEEWDIVEESEETS